MPFPAPISLRDYIAAQVMASFVTDSTTQFNWMLNDGPKLAYQMADAMLRARDPNHTEETLP